MNATATKTWTLDLRDDLFALQHPEDGSEFTASVFYVVATEASGRRFAHDHQFKSAEVFSEYEEDGWFCGIHSFREKALAQAQALLAKIQEAQKLGRWTGPLHNGHWREIEPVYGSEAYQDQRCYENLRDPDLEP